MNTQCKKSDAGRYFSAARIEGKKGTQESCAGSRPAAQRCLINASKAAA
jgi:hypothetical protein